MSDDDVCASCGRTYQWHRENTPRHAFTTGEGPLRAPVDRTPGIAADRGIRPTSFPFDPVLRMALIDAGVITTDQLDAAENKIKYLTGGLTDGGQIRQVDFQSGSKIRD